MSKPQPKIRGHVIVRAEVVDGEPSVVLTIGEAVLALSADDAAQVIMLMTEALKALASFGGSRLD